jgi:hypothetical protein
VLHVHVLLLDLLLLSKHLILLLLLQTHLELLLRLGVVSAIVRIGLLIVLLLLHLVHCLLLLGSHWHQLLRHVLELLGCLLLLLVEIVLKMRSAGVVSSHCNLLVAALEALYCKLLIMGVSSYDLGGNLLLLVWGHEHLLGHLVIDWLLLLWRGLHKVIIGLLLLI